MHVARLTARTLLTTLPLPGLGSPAAASPSKLFPKIAAIQSEACASLEGLPLTHVEPVALEPGKAGGEVAPCLLPTPRPQ